MASTEDPPGRAEARARAEARGQARAWTDAVIEQAWAEYETVGHLPMVPSLQLGPDLADVADAIVNITRQLRSFDLRRSDVPVLVVPEGGAIPVDMDKVVDASGGMRLHDVDGWISRAKVGIFELAKASDLRYEELPVTSVVELVIESAISIAAMWILAFRHGGGGPGGGGLGGEGFGGEGFGGALKGGGFGGEGFGGALKGGGFGGEGFGGALGGGGFGGGALGGGGFGGRGYGGGFGGGGRRPRAVTVRTNAAGLRVHWSLAIAWSPLVFGAPSPTVTGMLLDGAYRFGVDSSGMRMKVDRGRFDISQNPNVYLTVA